LLILLVGVLFSYILICMPCMDVCVVIYDSVNRWGLRHD